MNSVRRLRAQTQTTQAELARRAGTSQPTIAAYEAGTKSPSLRTLSRLALAVDRYLHVDFPPPLTRDDRRRIEVHRAIAAKLAADTEAVLDHARTNLSKMRRKHRKAVQLLDVWVAMLNLRPADLCELLVDPRPWVRELRRVTPFTGVLTAEEEQAVHRDFAENDEAA